LSHHSLRLEVVDSRRTKNDFYRVRCDLYRNDPAAVIPLQSMEWLQLDPNRHPFYQHSRREVWVAYQGNRPVGRIAAIVDDLNNEHRQEQAGFFGFFESPNEPSVANRLLDQAREWLQRQGCEVMRGPMSPSMKGEFGVLIDGFEHPPFLMMAHNPPYYHDLLTGYGLQGIKRFFAYGNTHASDDDELIRRTKEMDKICERILQRFPEISIETATHGNLETILRGVNRIGNVIRSQGWGFVPLTEAELDFNVKQLRRILDPKTIFAAFIDGQMAGYLVSIPNLNWAIKRCRGSKDWMRFPQLLYWMRKIPEIRCIALGVDPEIRAKGLSTLLTCKMMHQWPNFSRWEFGWIDEENARSISSLDRAVPLHQYKTYQVYEMPL
jgi:hypothetical protein